MNGIYFKYVAILLILAGSLFSCQEKEELDALFAEPLEVSFTEYFLCGNAGYSHWTNVEKGFEEGKLIIINSDDELKNHIVQYLDYPPIDFSKQTLLLAQGMAPEWVYSTKNLQQSSQKLYRISQNKYKLNIEVKSSNDRDGYNMPWNRALIVDKLSDNSIVELDVNILLEDKWILTSDESASIIGKWKLARIRQVFMMCDHERLMMDYSNNNIVYEFKPDGILTITGENSVVDGLYAIFDIDDDIDDDIFRHSPYYPNTRPILKINDWYHLYRISSEKMIIDDSAWDGPVTYFVTLLTD